MNYRHLEDNKGTPLSRLSMEEARVCLQVVSSRKFGVKHRCFICLYNVFVHTYLHVTSVYPGTEKTKINAAYQNLK